MVVAEEVVVVEAATKVAVEADEVVDAAEEAEVVEATKDVAVVEVAVGEAEAAVVVEEEEETTEEATIKICSFFYPMHL